MLKFKLSEMETRLFDNGLEFYVIRSNSTTLANQLIELGFPFYARSRGQTHWEYFPRNKITVLCSRFGTRVNGIAEIIKVEYKFTTDEESKKKAYQWIITIKKQEEGIKNDSAE